MYAAQITTERHAVLHFFGGGAQIVIGGQAEEFL